MSKPGAALPVSTWLVLLAMATLIVGALLPVLIFAFAADDTGAVIAALGDPVIWRALRFTLWQAGLSTVLSVVFAAPIAFALHDRGPFPGRRLILQLFALPLALPQIVAVLAIIALYGQSGWFNALAGHVDLQMPSIFGLTGILLAHVFFNLPLAVRVLVAALDGMPKEYRLLTAQMNLSLADRVRIVHWPAARAPLMQAATLIFMLCVTSFTVVLTLGGGPRATTLEVAIYQALTFDFDLARASTLIALQLLVTALVAAVLSRSGAPATSGETLEPGRHPSGLGGLGLPGLLLIVGPAVLFVALPFVAVIANGLTANLVEAIARPITRQALATSVILALLSGLVAASAAWALAQGVASRSAARRHRGTPSPFENWLTTAPSLVLVLPPLVLAAGWFLLLRQFVDPFSAGPVMIVAINALMALPFAARLVFPAVITHHQRHDRLCAQLGLGGWSRFWTIDFAVLRAPLAAGFGFAMALSLGDVSVIALYGSRDLVTLPSLILQNMGSYRSTEAQALALVLCVLTAIIMLGSDRIGGRKRIRS